MKMKVLAAVTIAALITGGSLRAEETLSQTLNNLPKVEIPAYASKLVMQSEKDMQKAEATKIVKIVAVQNEALLVQTVAAISKAVPTLAAEIAAVAAKTAPKLAEQIALRASQAAPQFAPQIAAAVAKEVPKKAFEIAQIAQAGTEGADIQIAAAVAQVVPTDTRISRISGSSTALSAQTGETLGTPVSGGQFGTDANDVEEVLEEYFE